MSVAAWRLTRDEKRRSAARVAALSLAAVPSLASADGSRAPRRRAPSSRPAARRRGAPDVPLDARRDAARQIDGVRQRCGRTPCVARDAAERPAPRRARSVARVGLSRRAPSAPQRQRRPPAVARDRGRGLVRRPVRRAGVDDVGTARHHARRRSARTSPLELVSLRHERQNDEAGGVGTGAQPGGGKPVEHLSAVVFLFDRRARSSPARRANVDFLKLGAGDESPFVVSLDAPATVARYRVSFRTDDGIVPHIDRRGAAADRRPKASSRSACTLK